MEDIQFKSLANYGFAVGRITDSEMSEIRSESDYIKSNMVDAEPYNNQLLGNIGWEFRIKESLSTIERLSVDLLKTSGLVDLNAKPKLAGAWINFQRKYEFNPPHHHDGDFVSVIYVNIPYTQEEEFEISTVPRSKNIAGCFSFYYINALGRITPLVIPTDKRWENHIIVFPAQLTHAVYPFYSSSDLRISISGNLYL